MQPDVSNIVSAKYHSRTQLALYAYVHLNRPWRFVIRVKETCSRKVYSPSRQLIRQENPVCAHRVCREGSLQSSLESRSAVCKDLSCTIAAARSNGGSDRCVADCVRDGLLGGDGRPHGESDWSCDAEEVCRPVSEPYHTPGPRASHGTTIARILSGIKLAGCKLQLAVE